MTDSQLRYRTLVAAGLCPGCKGPPRPGKTRCLPCQEKCAPKNPAAIARKRERGRQWMARLKAKRIARGQCGGCGEPKPGINPRTGKRYTDCISCLMGRIASQRKRRGHVDVHKCGRCGELGHTRPVCERLRRSRLDQPTAYAPISVVEYASARVAA